MAVLNVTANFGSDFQGELVTSRARAPIGSGEGRLAPYDLLLGALASCFYSTFMDIMEKKRLGFDSATVEVSGEKRGEVPMTLRWVKLRLVIRGASERKPFEDAAALAAKYCSIHETLSKVAEMGLEVVFE